MNTKQVEGFNSIENTCPDVCGKRIPDCGLKSSDCVIIIIADLEMQFTEVTSEVVVTLEKQNTFREFLSLNVFLVSL